MSFWHLPSQGTLLSRRMADRQARPIGGSAVCNRAPRRSYIPAASGGVQVHSNAGNTPCLFGFQYVLVDQYWVSLGNNVPFITLACWSDTVWCPRTDSKLILSPMPLLKSRNNKQENMDVHGTHARTCPYTHLHKHTHTDYTHILLPDGIIGPYNTIQLQKCGRNNLTSYFTIKACFSIKKAEDIWCHDGLQFPKWQDNRAD